MNTVTLPHAFTATLELPQERGVSAVRDALAEESVGILYEIDMRETMRQKLGVEIPRHTLLGVCIAPLAYRAMLIDPSAAVLLPCSISVREEADGRSRVEVLDPVAQIGLAAQAELVPIAQEASTRLHQVMQRLAQHRAKSAAPVVEPAEEIC